MKTKTTNREIYTQRKMAFASLIDLNDATKEDFKLSFDAAKDLTKDEKSKLRVELIEYAVQKGCISYIEYMDKIFHGKPSYDKFLDNIQAHYNKERRSNENYDQNSQMRAYIVEHHVARQIEKNKDDPTKLVEYVESIVGLTRECTTFFELTKDMTLSIDRNTLINMSASSAKASPNFIGFAATQLDLTDADGVTKFYTKFASNEDVAAALDLKLAEYARDNLEKKSQAVALISAIHNPIEFIEKYSEIIAPNDPAITTMLIVEATNIAVKKAGDNLDALTSLLSEVKSNEMAILAVLSNIEKQTTKDTLIKNYTKFAIADGNNIFIAAAEKQFDASKKDEASLLNYLAFAKAVMENKSVLDHLARALGTIDPFETKLLSYLAHYTKNLDTIAAFHDQIPTAILDKFIGTLKDEDVVKLVSSINDPIKFARDHKLSDPQRRGVIAKSLEGIDGEQWLMQILNAFEDVKDHPKDLALLFECIKDDDQILDIIEKNLAHFQKPEFIKVAVDALLAINNEASNTLLNEFDLVEYIKTIDDARVMLHLLDTVLLNAIDPAQIVKALKDSATPGAEKYKVLNAIEVVLDNPFDSDTLSLEHKQIAIPICARVLAHQKDYEQFSNLMENCTDNSLAEKVIKDAVLIGIDNKDQKMVDACFKHYKGLGDADKMEQHLFNYALYNRNSQDTVQLLKMHNKSMRMNTAYSNGEYDNAELLNADSKFIESLITDSTNAKKFADFMSHYIKSDKQLNILVDAWEKDQSKEYLMNIMINNATNAQLKGVISKIENKEIKLPDNLQKAKDNLQTLQSKEKALSQEMTTNLRAIYKCYKHAKVEATKEAKKNKHKQANLDNIRPKFEANMKAQFPNHTSIMSDDFLKDMFDTIRSDRKNRSIGQKFTQFIFPKSQQLTEPTRSAMTLMITEAISKSFKDEAKRYSEFFGKIEIDNPSKQFAQNITPTTPIKAAKKPKSKKDPKSREPADSNISRSV